MSTANPISWLTVPQRLGSAGESVRAKIWQALCKTRVAIPCIVQSFDPVKQTITAQPAIQEKMNVTTDGAPVPTDMDLPLLLDIPVVMLRSGGFVVTLPVNPGDECLVVFADMCIDGWYQNGKAVDPNGQVHGRPQLAKRRHSLSDGVAILGCWSQPRALQNYSVSELQIKSEDGNSAIGVAENYLYVNVANAGQITIDSNGVTVIPASGKPIALSGDVNISGKLTVAGQTTFNGTTVFAAGSSMSGTVTIDGRSFLLHTHTGVTAGGSNTGGVV